MANDTLQPTLTEIYTALHEKHVVNERAVKFDLEQIGEVVVSGKTPTPSSLAAASAKREYSRGLKDAMEVIQCYRSGLCAPVSPQPVATQ